MKLEKTNKTFSAAAHGFTNEQKLTRISAKYTPVVMSDAAVYDMARHWYTAEEIAARFCVKRNTVLDLHGAAYDAGKAEGMNMPRIQLARVINAFALLEDAHLCQKDVPVERLLKAIELHARKYEGLGQNQTVTHKQELPSVSDIRFAPLTADTDNDNNE